MALEYFCAYHSYLDAMEPLTDAERGRLFVACLEYSKSGATRHLSGNERFIFPMLRSQIERDKVAYQERCRTNRANGTKGGTANATAGGQSLPTATDRYQSPPKEKEKEKEKTKEKENIIHPSDVCAELPGSPTPVAMLPLTDGTEYAVLPETAAELQSLYPAVDVNQELRNMRGWLIANPKNRKTRAGIMRFVNGWLAREQNQSRPEKSSPRWTKPEVPKGASGQLGEAELEAIQRVLSQDYGG